MALFASLAGASSILACSRSGWGLDGVLGFVIALESSSLIEY
jgi:hypothetical protein